MDRKIKRGFMSEETLELKTIRQELAKIRGMLTDVTQYMRGAESEVPEEMRRFTM